MKVSKKYRFWTLVLILLAVSINAYIIVHSCLDAAQSTEASNTIVNVSEDVVNTIAPGTITPENHDSFGLFIRKLFGHFGLFVISGLLSSLAIYFSFNPLINKKYYQIMIISLCFGLLMGLITEMIQLFIPGRSGELLDVLIDFAGYLLGFLIILLILLIVLKHQYKKSQEEIATKTS